MEKGISSRQKKTLFYLMTTKLRNKHTSLIGIISDTHGFLHPMAAKALKNSDLIIHAGDINGPVLLSTLQSIAPVVAIRGNMDKGKWALGLPETEIVEVGEVLLYVLHDLNKLDIDPAAAGFSAVISGHSHHPSCEKTNGVLFLNPGSASLPRSNYHASIALMCVYGRSLDIKFIELE